MSCASIDIREYVLGEAPAAERRRVEDHVHACAACQEELERLRVTHSALLTVREEEPLRRIAFVSDKVFEPRWYQRIWGSAPRLAFASMALLAVAVFSHSPLFRPGAAPAPVAVSAPAPDTAMLETRVQAEVDKRLESAIRQAVAEVETRQERRTAELLKAAEDRFDQERRADMLVVQENFDVLRKRMNILYTASAEIGAAQ